MHEPINFGQKLICSLLGLSVVELEIFKGQIAYVLFLFRFLQLTFFGRFYPFLSIEKEFCELAISAQHLVERVYFEDIEGHEGADQGWDAPLIYHLLLRTHVIKCRQIYDISDFNRIYEGIDEPASWNWRIQLKRLLFLTRHRLTKGQNFSFLARGELSVNNLELWVANLTKSVLDILTDVII